MVPSSAPANRLPSAFLAVIAIVGIAAGVIFVLGLANSFGAQPAGSPDPSSAPGTTITGLASPTAAPTAAVSQPPGPTPLATSSGETRPPSADPGTSPTPTPDATPPASPTPSPTLQGGSKAAYVTHGKRNQKWIALTFDAEMYRWMYAERKNVREFDPRIIKLLKDTRTPATIFLNGLYVKVYPELVKQLAKMPDIELANHTWDHAGWVRCTNTTPIQGPMTKTTEVTKVEDIVKQVTGVKVRYFRYPGGCYGGGDLETVKALGERPIGWDCYFGDSLNWTASQQIASVKDGCQNGSIVITHLNGPPYHSGVYEALKVLIPWWKDHGWRVVNIGTMLDAPTPRPPQ
jgi:peptidoglycan/xylan/chitin deacetylase (PgdA/CDA1 family)